MMQESLIKTKSNILIGYVLERNGVCAKVRVTGTIPARVAAGEDLLKIAEEGALERTHINGSVVDLNDAIMIVKINKV